VPRTFTEFHARGLRNDRGKPSDVLESASSTAANRRLGRDPDGTEIRIVDANGDSLPDGERGEVAIRGPGVTPGYLENPEANEAAFVGSWFRTGDLGFLEHGYLRLQGRLKELIIRGGENISPAEIEDVLKAAS
jgi:acyl-CoA synthetase (AMP-forming)/AMP-acid ligase II